MSKRKLNWIYAELNKYAEGVNILNKGVEDKYLKETEEIIDSKLPVDYREFLKKYNGGSLLDMTIEITPVYTPDFSEEDYISAYLHQEKIGENKYGIPVGYLVISDTGYGDLVCMDTNSPDSKVVHWGHEEGEAVMEWDSFSDWLFYKFKIISSDLSYDGEWKD